MNKEQCTNHLRHTIALLAFTGVSGCSVESTLDFGAGGAPAKALGNDELAQHHRTNKDALEFVSAPNNATPCIKPSDCPGGFCVDGVCCTSACTSLCQACTAAKRGSGVDGTCGNISVGLDPDNECAGTCNGFGGCSKGAILLGLAADCSSGAQCASGACVDGVCCDSGCTGTCKACTAAVKGSGVDGVCDNIAASTDPENECAAGDCNGAGACGLPPGASPNGSQCSSGNTCLSGFCVDGVCCNSACTTTCMACSASKKGSGANGMCGSVAGGTDPDNECALGNCDGSGACSASFGATTGAPCVNGNDCQSGFCVDSVCCDNACTGLCMACTTAKKGNGADGQCGAIANATDPDNECAATCNGAGACIGNSAGGLPAGSVCLGGSECESRICNNLVCESSKPANGPLMWMTLRDASSIPGGSRLVSLTEISSKLDVGTDIAVNGAAEWVGWDNALYSVALRGGFSAAGAANLATVPIGAPPTDDPIRHLYRGGADSYHDNLGICACRSWWPGYPTSTRFAQALAGAGKNDAGQQGAMVRVSNCVIGCLFNSFDVGDGIAHGIAEQVLVRYSPTGIVELDIPSPSELSDPIVLGPTGEFHSIDLPSVVKYTAAGVLAWSKFVMGTFASSGGDVDATGNILIGFSYTGTVDFGAGPMTAAGTDLGLVKLDPAGNVVWQKTFAGGVEDVHLVRAGAADFAVLARRTTAMNLGTGAITGNTFVAKFDSSGTAQWHANFDDMGTLTLTADKAGSVYVGTSSLTANFGWGTPMANWPIAIAMAKYGTCTGGVGCKARQAACSANTECSSGNCVAGTCF